MASAGRVGTTSAPRPAGARSAGWCRRGRQRRRRPRAARSGGFTRRAPRPTCRSLRPEAGLGLIEKGTPMSMPLITFLLFSLLLPGSERRAAEAEVELWNMYGATIGKAPWGPGVEVIFTFKRLTDADVADL